MNASGAGRHGWAPTNGANMYGGGDGDVCVCANKLLSYISYKSDTLMISPQRVPV